MLKNLEATTGKTYYHRQIIQIDGSYYLLLNLLDNKGVSRFQALRPPDRDPQDKVAQTGDKLELEPINIGDTITIDSAVYSVSEDNINKYVDIDIDEPYKLDMTTVSEDRTRKLFKIIDTAERWLQDSEEKEKYKYSYICILNVKPEK